MACSPRGARGTVIEIDSCPTGPWRCTVDGIERRCAAGHGALLVNLTGEFFGPTLSIIVIDCLGPEVTATIGAAEVRLRRIAP